MELKGSRTEANLMAAFAGESQARNKYTYYGEQAKKQGFDQIGDLFLETARNEMAHAKLWYMALNGNEIHDTDVNLKMRQLVKIMNGHRCMRNLQRWLKRKDLIA